MTSRQRIPQTVLGFPRYEEESTSRCSKTADHNQPPAHSWPSSTASESLGLGQEPNFPTDTRGTGWPLSLVSSSSHGLGWQIGPSACEQFGPRPCQSCTQRSMAHSVKTSVDMRGWEWDVVGGSGGTGSEPGAIAGRGGP